jgi:hypothetical protein
MNFFIIILFLLIINHTCILAHKEFVDLRIIKKKSEFYTKKKKKKNYMA